MNSPFAWDIVALIILAIVFFSTFFKHMTEGQENRSFLRLQVVTIFMAIFDLTSELLNRNPVDAAWWLPTANILTYLYFLSRHLMNVVYVLYIISVSGIRFALYRKIHRVLIFCPFIVSALMVLSNIITGRVFTISFEKGYIRGADMIIVYLLGAFYVLVGVYYLLKCYNYLDKVKWYVIVSMYIMTILAVIWQGLVEGILVEMLAYSLVVLMNHLLVLRTEEMMDVNVDMYSWWAYREHLRRCEIANHPLKIVVIRYLNAFSVRSIFGEGRYNAFLRERASEIRKFLKKEKTLYSLYYGPVGCICIVLDDDKYNETAFMDMLTSTFETLKTDNESLASVMNVKYAVIRFLTDIMHTENAVGFTVRFPEFVREDKDILAQADFEHNKDLRLRNHLIGILNRAIKDRNFEMYYQPIFDLRTGTFRYAEALIRLIDPKFGFISPAVFIQEAENLGLMNHIGHFVLDSVFSFMSEIKDANLGLDTVEINLSIQQCTQRDLPLEIDRLQKRYRIDPSTVNFEITETMSTMSPEIVSMNMAKICRMGFSFSLDDYGTGFSNMVRILRMPLNIVKIDKSLIDTIKDERSKSIIANTIRMMHGIGLEVTCEGVESREVVEQLKEMGCDYIQGYYFSKPLPKKEFVDFLKFYR